MSPALGMRNLSGSEPTSPSRHSFGNAKPMIVSSREKARYTIRPTRNFTRSRTSASVVRGRLSASGRTSSMVTTTRSSSVRGLDPADVAGLVDERRRVDVAQPREVVGERLGLAGAELEQQRAAGAQEARA